MGYMMQHLNGERYKISEIFRRLLHFVRKIVKQDLIKLQYN